eukprot:TRINITY_DN1039_c0_g2_i1.p1 TRINITY_DN1039_c0_g2~~TRINITY_DN1039_c0_g2_i1.p1  ORF type:complete len:274 (+),score=49.29 TRINITY_DN1039_c0_g2_i1:156-977(+)
MLSGTVKKFFAEKGWGFIAADDGSGDVFAPARTFSGSDTEIREGLRVNYEAGVDNSSGKTRASTWSIADGASPAAAAVQSAVLAAQLQGRGTGTLKKFWPEKGFGFIQKDDDGTDMFAPSRTFSGGDAAIQTGMRVSFEAGTDDKTGKPRASSWSALDPAGMAACGSLGAYGAIPTQVMGADRFSPYGVAAIPGMGAFGLPQGWEAALDPASGRTYYCNRSTGETSWTPPVAAAAPSASSLPAGWEQATDPSSGKVYYFNRALNQTSWEVPQA